jgi:hypothetical protein
MNASHPKLTVVIKFFLVAILATAQRVRAQTDPPEEMRAVYITTAFNSDWPSRSSMGQEEAQDEINAIVNRVVELECNTIFLQVRGLGDRIYKTTITTADAPPWSQALVPHATPPQQEIPCTWDPDALHMWLTTAHNAGLDVYAWINLYRMDFPIPDLDDAGHNLPFYNGHDGFLYLHPYSEHVQSYMIKVFNDLWDHYTVRGEKDARGHRPKGGDGGLDGIVVDHYFPAPPTRKKKKDEDKDTPHVEADTTGLNTRRAYLIENKNNARIFTEDAGLRAALLKHISKKVRDDESRFAISPAKGQNSLIEGWLRNDRIEMDFLAPQIYDKDINDFQTQLRGWITTGQLGNKPDVIPVFCDTKRQRPHGNDPLWKAGDIKAQMDFADNPTGGPNPKPLGHIHYGFHAMRAPASGGPAQERELTKWLAAARYSEAAVPKPHGAHRAEEPQVTSQGNVYVFKLPDPVAFKVRRWLYSQRLRGTNTWTKYRSPKREAGDPTPGVVNSIPIDAKFDKLRVIAVDLNNRRSKVHEFP